MSSDEVRLHLKQTDSHRYAAYQLAPHYYDWIRIHIGTLPGGIRGDRFEIQSTKYYTADDEGPSSIAVEATSSPKKRTFYVYTNTYATDAYMTR